VQIFKIAMFLAIVFALQGAFGSAMQHTDTDWFGGEQNKTNFTNSSGFTQEDMAAMSTGDGMGAEDAPGIFYRAIKGTLWVVPELSKVFYVPDDESPLDPKPNAFMPFLLVIQAGIWLIYIIGIIQVVTKQQIKYGY
jgi:hypothetical protein